MKHGLGLLAFWIGVMVYWGAVTWAVQNLPGELLVSGYIVAFLAFAAWLYRRKTGPLVMGRYGHLKLTLLRYAGPGDQLAPTR
jgi:hypothetical protein